MAPDSPPIHRPFQVFEVAVRLTNPAQRKAIEGAIELLELELESVTVQVPSGSCRQGQTIQFHVQTVGGAREIAFEAPARVTRQSLDAGGKGSSERDTIVLTFQKHDARAWGELRDRFQDRQVRAIGLFERLKD